MDTISDEQLLEAYGCGDQKAFVTLIKRYERELYNYLLRYLGKAALAEDVFQETFLQVHLSLNTFEPDRKFRPWVYTIATNKARDLMRKQARRPAVHASDMDSGTEGEGGVWDSLLRDEVTPVDIVDQRQQRDRVRQIVAGMPDHLREILVMAYFNQLPYKDMAEALGIPLGTVKSRLHSAVGYFAQRYQERDKENAS